jgi:hypothetical protein
MQKRIFLPLLLTFAAGCSADAAPEPNVAVTMPIASEAAAPMPVVPTGAPTATARSMCAKQEVVLFSCATSKGKRASLCASRGVSAEQGYLYYAYGLPGNPELVFPGEKRAPADFKRTQLTFAGSTGGYAYSFENGGYRYIVYSVSGAEGLEDQGVLITKRDARKAISALSCSKGSVIEDDDTALLDLTLTWPADVDLDQHGLPKRN